MKKGYHYFRKRYGVLSNAPPIVTPWHRRQLDMSPGGLATKLVLLFGVGFLVLLILAVLIILFL